MFYFYIYLDLKYFTRFLCAKEYRNNFKHRVITRNTSDTRKVIVKRKLYLMTKMVSQKVTAKRKSYIQGYPENRKLKFKREKVIVTVL